MVNLINEIDINNLQEANEILKAAGTEDLFEKAHKDGDIHKNGKWVWVSSAAGGKGDWRTLNGRTHKNHQANNGGGGATSTTTKTTETKTSNSETYSHDINGVTVAVSKNKDGSYTLEANGNKVKSDDPSFFKDKLTPRVKKALAKEVGIDTSTTSKKANSNSNVKKIDVSSAKKMMAELGDSTWWGLKNSDRPTNDYSYFVGISQGSGKAKGKLFVRLQGDAGNTDMTTSVPFEEFFKNGSYEGGRGIRTWSAEKKTEIMEALLKNYKERTSPAGKKKAATEKQIEKITDIARDYRGNDLYTQYKRYINIDKYSTNAELAKHDAYYKVDDHLKEWIKDNATTLADKSDAEIKSAVAKEAKTFMDDYIKTFDAAKYKKQHMLLW